MPNNATSTPAKSRSIGCCYLCGKEARGLFCGDDCRDEFARKRTVANTTQADSATNIAPLSIGT